MFVVSPQNERTSRQDCHSAEKTPIDYLDESFIRSLAQRYQVSAYTMLLRLAQGNVNSPV